MLKEIHCAPTHCYITTHSDATTHAITSIEEHLRDARGGCYINANHMLSTQVVQTGKLTRMPPRSLDRNNTALLVEFGQRVRTVRRAAGLSQEALADKAGLHRTYVGHVERGESNLTLTSMVTLSEALEVDPADLVAGLRSDPVA